MIVLGMIVAFAMIYGLLAILVHAVGAILGVPLLLASRSKWLVLLTLSLQLTFMFWLFGWTSTWTQIGIAAVLPWFTYASYQAIRAVRRRSARLT